MTSLTITPKRYTIHGGGWREDIGQDGLENSCQSRPVHWGEIQGRLLSSSQSIRPASGLY